VLGSEGATDAPGELRAAFGRSGLDVLELRTDRERNVALHREVWARAAEAVREAVAGTSPVEA
jgi:2-succinyl-5-enolpyruvyl-6-hydroxy-3-cyclohexene-1-carboxylate synthase